MYREKGKCGDRVRQGQRGAPGEERGNCLAKPLILLKTCSSTVSPAGQRVLWEKLVHFLVAPHAFQCVDFAKVGTQSVFGHWLVFSHDRGQIVWSSSLKRYSKSNHVNFYHWKGKRELQKLEIHCPPPWRWEVKKRNFSYQLFPLCASRPINSVF